MNSDQVEAMYRKLTEKVGVRMTPHRFRHTLATDLMKAPERNIHLTKCLLNHSNIQTTMSYIEADYDHMRAVLHARSLAQGALENVRKVDYSGSPQASAKPKPCGQPLARVGEVPPPEARTEPSEPREHTQETGIQRGPTSWEAEAVPQPPDTFEQSVLFTLMAQHLSTVPPLHPRFPPQQADLVEGDLPPETVSPSETCPEGPAAGRKGSRAPSRSLGL